MTQQPIPALDSVRVHFSSEMFCGSNKTVFMPMLRRIKSCVNMANFIRELLEVFCFSSANLKSNKPLCGAVYCGPEPNIFLNYAQLIELRNLDFFVFLGTFSNFTPAFFTQFITETRLTLRILSIFLKPFPSKIQLYCFSSDILRVARVGLPCSGNSTFYTNITAFCC